MLRSNVTDWGPEELWRAYIQLTEAEAAFRCQSLARNSPSNRFSIPLGVPTM